MAVDVISEFVFGSFSFFSSFPPMALLTTLKLFETLGFCLVRRKLATCIIPWSRDQRDP